MAVRGGAGIDYVEVLHDERVVHRQNVFAQPFEGGLAKVHVEVGWGEAKEATAWDVELRVVGGELLDVEPRFRGPLPSVEPPAGALHAPHTLTRPSTDAVRFTTSTYPNPASAVPAMEGVCLEMRGDVTTEFEATVNGRTIRVSLGDLSEGSRTHHLAGFVSPALVFHRAVPEAEYTTRFDLSHRPSGPIATDMYRVRVRQRNEQWAWSSPIWVEPSASSRR